MKARHLRANKYFQLTAWFLIASHLFWGQVVLAQSFPADTEAVGLVSNLTGQVFLHHSYQPAIAEPLVFKGPVVYGDIVRTGDDSMLGMLIGNEALVVMEEQSELQLSQDANAPKVVYLLNGQVCVSTKKDGLPIVLKTTVFSITVEPASIVTVKLTTPTNQSDLAMQESLGQSRPILFSGYSLASQEDLVPNTNGTMTVNVLEGNASLALNDSGVAHASLVSNGSGFAQMSLGTQQGVQVIGETISEPFQSPDMPWRIQEFQKNPQHTVTPEEAQAQIAGDQQLQADNLVAALFAPDPAAEFQPVVPPALIIDDGRIPTTDFNPPEANTTGSSPPTAQPPPVAAAAQAVADQLAANQAAQAAADQLAADQAAAQAAADQLAADQAAAQAAADQLAADQAAQAAADQLAADQAAQAAADQLAADQAAQAAADQLAADQAAAQAAADQLAADQAAQAAADQLAADQAAQAAADQLAADQAAAQAAADQLAADQAAAQAAADQLAADQAAQAAADQLAADQAAAQAAADQLAANQAAQAAADQLAADQAAQAAADQLAADQAAQAAADQLAADQAAAQAAADQLAADQAAAQAAADQLAADQAAQAAADQLAADQAAAQAAADQLAANQAAQAAADQLAADQAAAQAAADQLAADQAAAQAAADQLAANQAAQAAADQLAADQAAQAAADQLAADQAAAQAAADQLAADQAAQAAADQLAADQAAQAAADQLAADQAAAAQAAADAAAQAAAAPPPGPGESGFPASAGNPTVILESSTLAMDTPFLSATSGSPTIDGPPVILALQNYSGSTSNIPLSAVGNISPSVASDLLSAFGDPDNAGSLLAGIRTQNTASQQATILGGIALQNSTVVNASVEVAQFDDANVVIGGSFLELDASTLNGGDLFVTSGQNTITSGDDFITVDQGTLNALRVSGNPSNISLTINNGGFLTLTNNSNVSITNGFGFVFRDITSASTFVSVDNSQLEMGLTTDGVLARLSESFVVNSGGVLEVNNSGEVSVSSIIRGAGTTLSSGILNGTAIVVNNQSSVIANQAVKLENLVPTTELGLTVNNGGVLSLSNGSDYVDAQLVAASSPLVELVQSTMFTGSGFIDVNSGSTLVVPNDALVSLDASQLVVNGSLVNVTGANSVVSVTGAIFALQNGSVLEINGGALVDVSAGGVFNLVGPLGQFSGGTAANPNILSVTNNACAASACQAPFTAFPDLRVAGSANIPQGYNPLQGFDPSGNQLNISDDAAVLVNTGGTINLNN